MEFKSLLDAYREHAFSFEELDEWLLLFQQCRAASPSTTFELTKDYASLRLQAKFGNQLPNDVMHLIPADERPALAAWIMYDNSGRLRNSLEALDTYMYSKSLNHITLSKIPATDEMAALVEKRLGVSIYPLDMNNDPFLKLDADLSIRTPLHPASLHHHPRGLATLDTLMQLEQPSTGPVIRASQVPFYALRELWRVYSGEYARLPDSILSKLPADIYLHEVPHLAIKGSNAGKIAYTENARKGEEDVQSVMKPGKYLRRIMKDRPMNDQQLKEMVADLQSAAHVEIKSARLPEDAKWVYINGPDSCMAHAEDRFGETIDLDGNWRHPIEALFFEDGSGNIELLYVEMGERPAARVLVNTESKEYPAIYTADWMPSAQTLLREHLNEQGYNQCPMALEGVTIPMIKLKNDAVLCPYIDGGNLGVDLLQGDIPPGDCADKTMIIGGMWQAEYTNGYITNDSAGKICFDCEEPRSDEDMTLVESLDEYVCDDCVSNNFVHALNDCGEIDLYRTDDCTEVPSRPRLPSGDRIEYVHDNVTDGELEDAGLCRTISGDIHAKDDCFLVENGEDWVHLDEVANDYVKPDALDCDYISTDNGVYHYGDCIWLEDEERWEHEDEVDRGDYLIHVTQQGLSMATPVDDAA